MKLNLKKLRNEINALSNEIRFARANGGKSFLERQADEAYEQWVKMGRKQGTEEANRFYEAMSKSLGHSLSALKQKVTILCAIRAANHGRLHCSKVRNPYSNLEDQPKYLHYTLRDQEKMISPYLEQYQI